MFSSYRAVTMTITKLKTNRLQDSRSLMQKSAITQSEFKAEECDRWQARESSLAEKTTLTDWLSIIPWITENPVLEKREILFCFICLFVCLFVFCSRERQETETADIQKVNTNALADYKRCFGFPSPISST